MVNEKLDVIDRKALIAEYDRVHIGPPGGARKLMEDAPSVEAVEVVHGWWIKRIVDHEMPGYWINECSICGFVGDAYAFLYCPYCGAKMDGERREGE